MVSENRTKKMQLLLWKMIGVLLWLMLGMCSAKGRKPIVIAHRGNPCQFPEETLEGYKDAIEQRVDFIEMDVVSTKDGVLLTRHDLILDESTDVKDSKIFRGLNTTKTVDGVGDKTGFFTIDFNIEEIRQLKARQRLSFRNQSRNDQFEIPKLSDVLQEVKQARGNGSSVGAYIELKYPEFHERHNISLDKLLFTVLNESGLLRDPGAIYLQSFSKELLEKMNDTILNETNVKKIPMTWLLGCSDAIPTKDELESFKLIGEAIGVSKSMLVEMNEFSQECGRPNDAPCDEVVPGQHCTGTLDHCEHRAIIKPIVDLAREVGLKIHAYTFRNEEMFMALDFLADPRKEFEFYARRENKLRLDGLFVDCPETAIELFGKAPPLRRSPRVADYVIALTFLGVVFIILFGFYLIYLCRLHIRPRLSDCFDDLVVGVRRRFQYSFRRHQRARYRSVP